jgi:SET domain
MGKKSRTMTTSASTALSGDIAVPSISKKAKGSSLSAVLNLEAILCDGARWNIDNGIAATLATVEQAVQKIRHLQSSWPCAIPQRDAAAFDNFREWLCMNGVDMRTASFRFGRVTDGDDASDNATLFAIREIPAGQTFVSVPSSIMLSSKTAAKSSIAEFLESAPALRSVPSIVLSLHLLAEAVDCESFFRPYIQVLPAHFSIPFSLPFSAADMMSLQPSIALARAVRTLRSLLMQYTKIYSLLAKLPAGNSALSIDVFSFANFEWAVSVAMTRQNELPSAIPGLPPALALVPVWDMCNHAAGPHTTSVFLDPATDTAIVECAAMRTFAEGDAITMRYGQRPNVELLLYSGFIQADNEYDAVPVPVSFDGDDRRENVAKVVLARRQLSEAGLKVASGTDENGFMTLSGVVSGKDGGTVDDVLVAIASVKAMNLANPDGYGADSDGSRVVQVLIDSIGRLLEKYSSSSSSEFSAPASAAKSLVSRLHAEEKRMLVVAKSRLEKEGVRNYKV